MAKLPPLNGKPKRPSKYAPKKCPECGEELDEEGECEECGYGCEECEAEKEAAKQMEIKLSILLPGGD
jgi:hypothetical protein